MEWFQDGTKLLVSGPVGPQEKQGIWIISVIGATLRKLRDDAHLAAGQHASWSAPWVVDVGLVETLVRQAFF